MTKFSKEEIKLSRKIAEKWRKKIEFGDWFIVKDITSDSGWSEPKVHLGIWNASWSGNISLWTLSDCLEFLEKNGFNDVFHFMQFKNGNWSFTAEDNRYKKVRGEGKTKLTACLKAVLAVLEEE